MTDATLLHMIASYIRLNSSLSYTDYSKAVVTEQAVSTLFKMYVNRKINI